MRLLIAQIGRDRTISFAASQLHDYLIKMDPAADLVMQRVDKYDPSRDGVLWVGQDGAFADRVPSVKDSELDDAVYIDVERGAGIVTGANPRSVLIAVYRLLRENGFRFLRPGAGGEKIPCGCAGAISAHVSERAANRHRGVCIEGAISCQNARDMIDWLPKAGMNAYFTQFFTPSTFFVRWYEHRNNPTIEPEPISRTDIDGILKTMVDDIEERGLIYHAVGHGWTCEPFGIEGDSWDQKEYFVPEEVKGYLAELKGERKLTDVPLNVNLCYGNVEVREAITSAIAEHCKAHPEIDYLHFWLADGTNNHCECPLCRDTMPSDFYVMMLNRLDEKLTGINLKTRVVFLTYVDLLWAPATETINNPDRFALMFAPITRTYSNPFAPDSEFDGELVPYIRNKNVMPSSVPENLARLKSWERVYSGDSFDFDYHFMWDHFLDIGYYEMARILMTDMLNLKKIGLNGMMSCQNQRTFFPNGLGMCIMADSLWSGDISFEDYAAQYYLDAYGEDGEKVHAYLKEMSRLFDPPYLRGERGDKVNPERAAAYRELISLAAGFTGVTDANIKKCLPEAQRRMWRDLVLHGRLAGLLAGALAYRAAGDGVAASRAWESTMEYARSIEREVQPYFDFYEFTLTIGGRLFAK